MLMPPHAIERDANYFHLMPRITSIIFDRPRNGPRRASILIRCKRFRLSEIRCESQTIIYVLLLLLGRWSIEHLVNSLLYSEAKLFDGFFVSP